jgi:biotin operon repressor
MGRNFVLYVDASRQLFFLVPKELTILPGDFDVYTLVGQHKRVDYNAILPYQITRQEAEQWLSGEIRQNLDHAAETVKNTIKMLYDEWKWRGHPNPPAEYRARQAMRGERKWTLDLLADIMGESVEDLKTDKAAQQRGWERLLAGLLQIADGIVSTDPEKLDIARLNMQDLNAILRSHGIQVDARLDDLPDTLNDLYQRGKNLR